MARIAAIAMAVALALGGCAGGPSGTSGPSVTPGPSVTRGPVETPVTSSSGLPFTVTASRSLPGNPPALAVDTDPETAWIAGTGRVEWIQLELPSPMAVGSIVLLVTQESAGRTIHEIWVGASVTELERVDTLSGATADGDRLVAEVPESAGEVRVIRIVTTESPSWVGWREILLSQGRPQF